MNSKTVWASLFSLAIALTACSVPEYGVDENQNHADAIPSERPLDLILKHDTGQDTLVEFWSDNSGLRSQQVVDVLVRNGEDREIVFEEASLHCPRSSFQVSFVPVKVAPNQSKKARGVIKPVRLEAPEQPGSERCMMTASVANNSFKTAFGVVTSNIDNESVFAAAPVYDH